jgi:hypothetical protein
MPAPSTPKAFAPATAQRDAPSPFAMQRGQASSADHESGALTYQVYAPEALPPARPANLSRMSFPDLAPKPNIAARVGLAALAACVVLGTAVLIVFGTADEPRAKTATAAAGTSAAASTSASPNAGTIANGAASAPAPVASPAPVADPPPVVSVAIADPPPPPVAKPKGSKPKGASSAAALRGVALPPNPFSGGGGVAAKPAKKK